MTDSTGRVVQTTNYYPYGEPWREPTGQPMLFSGKERTSLSDYLYGPRKQIPAIGLWDAPDKHAYDYTSFSPYTYCGGNPISSMDLDGNDIYTFNEKGHLVEINENDEIDMVTVEHTNYSSIGSSYKKGTIEGAFERNTKSEKLVTGLHIVGDVATKDIFRFLAKNTDVEFSAILLDDDERNVVVTTGVTDEENGGGMIIQEAIDNQEKVREHIHNHPSGMLGFSQGDAAFYKSVLSNPGYENVKFYLHTYPETHPIGRRIRYSSSIKIGNIY